MAAELNSCGGIQMWTVRDGPVLARGRNAERTYLESEQGTKLILLGLDGRIEDGIEMFEYQERDISFEIVATRVDLETKTIRDFYTVWLGSALKAVSSKLPQDTLTLDRARGIAQNIKEALMVWQYPGKLADILSCHSSARDVVFVMKKWDRWDSALEGRWP
jgi:hypothetical protein